MRTSPCSSGPRSRPMSFISIFRDGKLKPGVYKIRNTASHTYVDIQDNQKDLCCRPLSVLGDKGQVIWRPTRPKPCRLTACSGKLSRWVQDTPYAGYGIQSLFGLSTLTQPQLESGGPDQFCTVLDGKRDAHGRTSVSVSTFPAVWRVELVQDQSTCGCENVR